MKSILIIIDYFGGKWPEWFPIFLESCRHNTTINWVFHTDCPCDSYNYENIQFVSISREDYIKNVNEKLNIHFVPEDNYKFCDLRPAYGILYEDEIKPFDFYGYGDIDLIYGDIRKFFTDDVLQNNVISTLDYCIAGHLSLFRNKKWIRHAYKRISDWKWLIEEKKHKSIDEVWFTPVFCYPEQWPKHLRIFYDLLHPFSIRYHKKIYLKEQYTTPLTPRPWIDNALDHPTTWYWKDGHITNNLDGNIEFIYLHFMNFRYARWMHSKYGKKGFWEDLDKIVHVKEKDIPKGVRIDPSGFHPLNSQSE